MPIFSDTFTGVSGTQLQSHTPDVGTSWTRLWGSNATLDYVINGSNQCAPESATNNGVIYTADASYPSANYDITFTGVTFTNLLTVPVFMLVRIQDQENMYAVKIHTNAQGAISSLYKKVAGVWSTLGSLFTGPANGSVCKLEIIGTALKFYDDGVVVASATDSDISAAGKAGVASGGGAELVNGGDDSNTGNVMDLLSVNDLGGAGIVHPVFATDEIGGVMFGGQVIR